MSRYLFVLLTILVAGLAIVLGGLWLWGGTIALLVGGLGLLGWRFWEEYQDREPQSPTAGASGSRESLEELGIVDPEDTESATDASESDQKVSASTGPDSQDSSSSGPSGREPPSGPSSTDRRGTESIATGETEALRAADRPVVTGNAPVLGPFVQSLRAALDAQTVCLLVQEEIALSYHIDALASVHPRVQRRGTFDTQAPLLTASMSRQSISIRRLTESPVAIEDLGYYTDPPTVTHLAVAPVPRPDEPTTTFLLADATNESNLDRSRSRTLLKRFAETAALLLDTDPTSSEDGERGRSQSQESGEEASEAPRPRREIIAEEMEAAEAAAEELSLVLVYLNRAESIARRGDEAVATAERLLRARLEQLTPDQRVERFGELTYGIFYRGDAETVESWVSDLEASMAEETGELEGGVSVGVAVWGARHDEPETLRADATEALREAYKTGTSTVVT